MKKKDKKLYIFGIAGLVAIIILYLFFFEKRHEEYSCIYADGSGPAYLYIEDKHLIFESGYEQKFLITKETKRKIFASVVHNNIVGKYQKMTFRKKANHIELVYYKAEGGVEAFFNLTCKELK